MDVLIAVAPASPPGRLTRFLDDPDGELARLARTALEWVTGPGRGYALLFAALVATEMVSRSALRRYWRRRYARGARLLTIRPPVAVDPAGGTALWRALGGLLAPAWKRALGGQPHLCIEYTATADGLRIGVWVPGTVPPGLVEHAIAAAWPGAHISTTPATDPLPNHGAVRGGDMRLVAPEWFPLAATHDADPLRPLLSATAHLHPGETACVQVTARPATGRRLRTFRTAAYQLRHGTNRAALPGGGLLREGVEVFLPGTSTRTTRPHALATNPDPFAIDEARLVRDKASHPQFDTRIRYAVATEPTGAATRGRARGLADEVSAAFAVFTGRNALRRRHLHRPAHILAARRFRRGFLLSVPELAALAHLPYDEHHPGLDRAGARAVPPRPVVPTEGKPLGLADAGPARPVAVSVPDARHHIEIIGATGAGKSVLAVHMMLADITAGRGLLAEDPKGDQITDLLGRIPAQAADRVILFDPDDPGPWPAINVLAGPDPHAATDNLVGIFRRIYTDFWGPRTDDILRAACLTLTHTPDATLADIPDLLTDTRYRTRLVAPVSDPVLRGFWTWYDQLSEPARAQAIAPLMNKLRSLLLRPFVRHTLCATRSTVDLADVFDHGGICLVRIPKGSLGADTTALVGSLILAKAWEIAAHRARRREPARADAAIYLDEAQNFLTLPHGIDDMLAEARAYRISLVLAHQDLAQLPPALREGIAANARNKIIFTVSPDDARRLARHVGPLLGEHDLAHLGAFHAAASILTDHAPAPAFTLRTQRLPPAMPGRERHIRNTSRARYGQPTTPTTPTAPPPGDPRRDRTAGIPPTPT